MTLLLIIFSCCQDSAICSQPNRVIIARRNRNDIRPGCNITSSILVVTNGYDCAVLFQADDVHDTSGYGNDVLPSGNFALFSFINPGRNNRSIHLQTHD